jgi:hypothetical protein
VWGANEWIFGYIESDISSRFLWDFCDLTRALELRKLLVFMPWKLQFNHFQRGKFLQFQFLVLLVYTPWIAPILEACDGQSWWTKGSCHYDAQTLHLLVGWMFFKFSEMLVAEGVFLFSSHQRLFYNEVYYWLQRRVKVFQESCASCMTMDLMLATFCNLVFLYPALHKADHTTS